VSIVPIKATLFEDFIDGYFPLNLSLGQMLVRHGFQSAWIFIRVAPMMEIPGLTRTDPVPLHLDPAHGGQIKWLTATIRLSGQIAILSGLAKWRWNDPVKNNERQLSTSLRLAEPAFLRGIGFPAGNVRSHSLDQVQHDFDGSNILLMSPGQPDIKMNNFNKQNKLRDPLCWCIDFPNGLNAFQPEATQTWASPYLKECSTYFKEGLLISDTDDLLITRIILDSLAY